MHNSAVAASIAGEDYRRIGSSVIVVEKGPRTSCGDANGGTRKAAISDSSRRYFCAPNHGGGPRLALFFECASHEHASQRQLPGRLTVSIA
jgi:hypothetical protein